jgi:hypothetical protein
MLLGVPGARPSPSASAWAIGAVRIPWTIRARRAAFTDAVTDSSGAIIPAFPGLSLIHSYLQRWQFSAATHCGWTNYKEGDMSSEHWAKRTGWLLSFAVLIISLRFVAPMSVSAQVAGATLSGTVTDPSGAVVLNSQMTIKNEGTGVTRNVSTDAAGFYSVPNLVPGAYELTVTASGFKTQVRSGIRLTVGAEQSLNITMEVGQVTQTVEVTGAAPTVQLATSTIGNVVDSTTVVELPLNGRDWTQLATLQSGVNLVQTQVTSGFTAPRGNRGFGTQLTISGTRPQMNNYRLDGISIVDYSGGSPGSVLGISVGVDAIGEFSVLTSNYAAEYGRTSGGVINAVTRSGTNGFHGDVYWFLRDEGLDSRGYFDAAQLPPFHRNQFGASAGGPIQKDKMFFFANYEGYRQVLGVTNVDNVPSQDARNGIIHNADGTITNITVDPKVKPYLVFWPLPNAGLVGVGNVGHFNVVASQNARENFVTNRIDRKISEKDSISGSWFLDKGYIAQPDTLNDVLLGNTSIRIMTTAEETHVFSPSVVNSFRIGYSRMHPIQNQPLSAIIPQAADTSLGALPGRAAPGLTVAGLRTFQGGLGAASHNDQRWNSYQLYDDAFWTKGAHSLKLGFAFENMRHSPENLSAHNGSFFFNGLTQFLQNQLHRADGPTQFIRVGLRQTLYGGYVQDDWRFRPNLTLNLGLRYEAVTVPSEVHGQLGNLRQFLTDTMPTLGSPLILNPTLRNFEPRVGFSWDPFHNGKTAVRGAFGIFDVLPLTADFFTATTSTFPFVTQVSVAKTFPQGSFPKVLTSLINAGAANSFAYQSYQFNPPRNYVMIWNLNVQRQLTPNTTLTLGYVGNHGVHMYNRSDDANTVLPVQYVNGVPLWPIPVGNGIQANPNINGPLQLGMWDGDALYDGLDVTLSKKFSHGFQAQGSYTWGKNIDTSSATTIPDPYSNSVATLYWFCSRCRRGLSDYNVGQNLTVNYIWDIPTPNSWGAVASYALGGWEVGGILTAHGGVPVSPLMAGDPLGQNNTIPNDFPDIVRSPGCQSLVNPGNVNNYVKLNCIALPKATPAIAAKCQAFGIQDGEPPKPGTCANLSGNAGRNSIVGPGVLNYDFSLFKNNRIKRISDSFNVQFRAEFFNILNHSNFETPVDNNTFFNEDGSRIDGAGALDGLSTTAREIQFGLKLIW